MAAISLAYTASISSIHRYSYFIALAFSSMWICGTCLPIARLPHILEYLAWVFPLTSVVGLSRDLMTGQLDARSTEEVLWLVISGLISWEVALRKLSKRMYR